MTAGERDPSHVLSQSPARPITTWVIVILALHLALGVFYSVAVPPWEAHDEWAHYKFVEYVARERALPPPNVRLTNEYQYDEATQPPLYYLMAALPVMLVDTDDAVTPDVNPYFGIASGAGGINAAVHHPDQERFPWHGTLLALHLARWMSLLISLLGLVAVYQIGRLLAPDRPTVALVGLAIAALSPQYLFISSVVTNDVLITALGCVIAWLGVKVMLGGLRPGPTLALALASGLALITKLSAPALLPFVLLALIAGMVRSLRRGGDRRVVPLSAAFLLAGSLLPIGFWFWRNWKLTGLFLPRDPWFWYRFVGHWFYSGGSVPSLRLADLPSAFFYGFHTFWASFGWGNLDAYGWVYGFFAVLSLVGVTGLIGWLARAEVKWDRKLAVGLLLVLAGSMLFVTAYRGISYGSSLVRGRYVLPSLGAVAVLSALGWGAWLSLLASKGRQILLLALGGVLVITNVLLPWRVIAPAYAPPPMAANADLRPGEQLLGARFGDAAELVAYDLWPERVRPGDALGVTLFWRILAPLEHNYTLGVHLLDASQNKVGEVNVYPGRGNYATTLWRSGDLLRETYWVTVEKPIPEPVLGRVEVSFFLDDNHLSYLPVADAHGNPLGDVVKFGRFKLAPDASPPEPPPGPGLAHLGPAIRLSDATWSAPQALLVAGGVFTVTLTWDALERPPADYQVFVHLEGPAGPEAFGDGPPREGSYPTSLWERGERIVDQHTVVLPKEMPAGKYRLVVGMYDAAGQRVAAYGPDGEPLAAGQVVLDYVRVARLDHGNFLPLLYGPLTGD